jgi:nucleoside-diphosphate-sugar epimerase
MKNILVTGGAGFIGSNLVSKLVADGYNVVVLDDLSTGNINNLHDVRDSIEFLERDLSKVEISFLAYTLKSRNIDTVFHLAALARVQPSIKDPITFNNINVNGTLNLLFACHKADIKRVVYSASSSAYGETKVLPTAETVPTNPLSPYGLQKLIGEQYCKMFSEIYNLETVSLRYFNVYGEKMPSEGAYLTVISIFDGQLKAGIPLTITNDGKQRRDFTYVGDIVEANILAATNKNVGKGEVFNIGNGDNYSINEVADMMKGEKTYGEQRIEPFETLADNTKAKARLGWMPKGNLPKWLHEKYKGPILGTTSSNKKEVIKKKIKYLEKTLKESNIGRIYDGYTIAGLKGEIKKLTTQLDER